MWTATWALNTLVAKAKSTDWMVHMLGQVVGAYTDAAHGMTLSAVSLPYYRYIMPYGLAKFKRFAVNVWDVDASGGIISRLEQKGLVEGCVDAGDKRIKLVRITQSGIARVLETEHEMTHVEENLLN